MCHLYIYHHCDSCILTRIPFTFKRIILSIVCEVLMWYLMQWYIRWTGSSYWQHLPVLVFIPYEYTCWDFDENTRIDILTHCPSDQMVDNILEIFYNGNLRYSKIIIAGCSLESKLTNVIVGLYVDLALFRRQAITGTSEDRSSTHI